MAATQNMDFEQARFNMVEQQIRPWEVLDPEVLNLMMTVKREDFVPAAYQTVAFADVEIPLSDKAKMFAPKLEAKLLQELEVKKSDRVLEIGAGSGFMAALLASRAGEVVSVEIDKALAEQARKNLQNAGFANVTVEVADGLKGFAAKAPYDVIVVSGGVSELPAELLRQLKVGGRLAAIVGAAPVMHAQLVTCTAEGVYATVNLFETVVDLLVGDKAPAAFSF